MKNTKKQKSEQTQKTSNLPNRSIFIQDKPGFYVQLAISIFTLLTLFVIAYQMIVQSRAWVTLKKAEYDEIQIGKKPTATLLFINSGSSPALNLTIQSNIKIGDSIPSKLPIQEYQEPSRSVIGPDSEFFNSISGNDPITSQQYLEIKKGVTKIIIFGHIEYDDIFGCHRMTEFCIYNHIDSNSFDVCTKINTVD